MELKQNEDQEFVVKKNDRDETTEWSFASRCDNYCV